MIKLNRGQCPEELTPEVQSALTELYKQDKHKDVWNSPKIKESLKDALTSMSHGKCAYCECLLDVESKDVTIDHFLPKSTYADKVVEWENLLPACLRCNRAKNNHEGTIVNPCTNEPKQYLGVRKGQPHRLKGIDEDGVGRYTIETIDLNDYQRVMTPRLQEWENVYQRLQEIYQDLVEEGYKEKYKIRFYSLMKACTKSRSYAATKATNLLNNELYAKVKQILQENGVWSDEFQKLEDEMEEIKLQMV